MSYPTGSFNLSNTNELLDDEGGLIYCEAEGCDAPAVACVPVSVNAAHDAARVYCASHFEVFVIGVQHGRYHEAANCGGVPKRNCYTVKPGTTMKPDDNATPHQRWERGAPPNGPPPWACRCKLDEVCGYCVHVLNRKPGDPQPARLVALFHAQVLIRDVDYDAGETIPFDVTEQILAMGQTEALAIKDNDYLSDELVPASLYDHHAAGYGSHASYWVEVSQAIRSYRI